MNIENCTKEDYDEIIKNISSFWGNDRTLHLHHIYLVYEFGHTAFVIKDKGNVVAYLFGFISQTEKLGYIHLVGVCESYQRKGLGKQLYNKFIEYLKSLNIKKIKAITTPTNEKSISFHKNVIGMSMLGKPNNKGIRVIENYSGQGNDRVVFEKIID